MIRPILDGVIVRMDPPETETAGGLIIPATALADVGTLRAKRQAKIGTVLAVGPGRHRRKRTAWEREASKRGPLKPDETARMWDAGSAGAPLPMEVKPGDRVLFDPLAELREVDPDDPLVRAGAAYQACARACRVCRSFSPCECVEADAWDGAALHIAAAAAWGAVATATGVGQAALKADEQSKAGAR